VPPEHYLLFGPLEYEPPGVLSPLSVYMLRGIGLKCEIGLNGGVRVGVVKGRVNRLGGAVRPQSAAVGNSGDRRLPRVDGIAVETTRPPRDCDITD
jgi:hypothetical protein